MPPSVDIDLEDADHQRNDRTEIIFRRRQHIATHVAICAMHCSNGLSKKNGPRETPSVMVLYILCAVNGAQVSGIPYEVDRNLDRRSMRACATVAPVARHFAPNNFRCVFCCCGQPTAVAQSTHSETVARSETGKQHVDSKGSHLYSSLTVSRHRITSACPETKRSSGNDQDSLHTAGACRRG